MIVANPARFHTEKRTYDSEELIYAIPHFVAAFPPCHLGNMQQPLLAG